jgi:RNA polymerase sigma factor (sigma-70 family)
MSPRGDDPDSLRNEVFSRVFDANWAAVRHHIECVVEDDAEVNELVSEVFLTAWSKLRVHRPMGRTWLLRVADRRLAARRGGPANRMAVTAAVHAGLTGDDHAECPATHAQILSALSGLRVRERRIIMLTYWDGLTVGETAESIGTSRSSVERTLRRAQRTLRRDLGLEGTGSDADDQ